MSSHLHRRLVAALVALAGLALTGPTAATTVTSNRYDALSTSSDIARSCRELSIAATGVLSAKCNKSSSGSVELHDTTIDMSDNTDCTGNATDGYSLAWATSASFDGNVINASVSLSSTGNDYIASGQCKPTGEDASPASTLDLSDTTNGLENDSGSLDKR